MSVLQATAETADVRRAILKHHLALLKACSDAESSKGREIHTVVVCMVECWTRAYVLHNAHHEHVPHYPPELHEPRLLALPNSRHYQNDRGGHTFP